MVDTCATSYENHTKDVEVMLRKQILPLVYGQWGTLNKYTPSTPLEGAVMKLLDHA